MLLLNEPKKFFHILKILDTQCRLSIQFCMRKKVNNVKTVLSIDRIRIFFQFTSIHNY